MIFLPKNTRILRKNCLKFFSRILGGGGVPLLPPSPTPMTVKIWGFLWIFSHLYTIVLKHAAREDLLCAARGDSLVLARIYQEIWVALCVPICGTFDLECFINYAPVITIKWSVLISILRWCYSSNTSSCTLTFYLKVEKEFVSYNWSK